MYCTYFKLSVKEKNRETIKTNQRHDQYGGYNEMYFDIDIFKNDLNIRLMEYSYSYSDPDGIRDDHSNYSLKLILNEETAKEFFVYHTNSKYSKRLESGLHHLDNGYITYVSSQIYDLDINYIEENLWKILWIFKNIVHTGIDARYNYENLTICDEVIKLLLQEYLKANLNETHFLIFQKFYYYGDCYEGKIEEKEQYYKWNTTELLQFSQEIFNKVITNK